ncbi:nicotinate-nucleotide--dimethylbenzimidazole phosphoribosyltransferase [Anaerotalea alkaliphila]|uniref:Nicotinate-nucleotide--dimethylbenzimidazole phosphoribosyltransferase n=1 Tax=Anaerotalea alkaliphila TaxID=2662126 RepID=A0A7X5KNV5_9FIRM|nr:nicotinate-nucleotide--dimethylbenzimidazole phosphoribosyltransferase [Anaerotalea alkaliphila]NDL68354.1 nicotinate-nucleotide--dimethylbenzimidazole phosphoribosyltransferase [Anaerotalea alkaliphila]
MTLDEAIRRIKPPDESAMMHAKARLDGIAKPLNSLGRLEGLIIKAAGIYRTDGVDFGKKCVVVMCADNGVVMEGVTQVSSEITTTVAQNMVSGMATISIMSQKQNADLYVVDIGINREISYDRGMINHKVRLGTENFSIMPAMTRDEAMQAIETGIRFASGLAQKGYKLIATGEMGIGNTTTSSAITAAFLDKEAAEVTGRGAGLSSEGLKKKINVIDDALRFHKPDKEDALDVLSKVGGLDIAGLCGVFIGCAASGTAAVVDGFVSSVAALCAVRLCPMVKEYMFASHISKEPAGRMLIQELDLPHYLDCEMCLGEGTGAVLSFPIFDLASEVYQKMRSFHEAKILQYVPLQ